MMVSQEYYDMLPMSYALFIARMNIYYLVIMYILLEASHAPLFLNTPLIMLADVRSLSLDVLLGDVPFLMIR